jgi:N utilization substance protein B
MNRRTRGREIALQVLYLLEQNPSVDRAAVDRFINRRCRDAHLSAFAHALVRGVLEKQPQIDAVISHFAENWKLDRMTVIDRNIIRLGAYEILFESELPTRIAINEALELAKRYSTAQSSRFVNGILDRLQGSDLAEALSQTSPAADPDAPAQDEPDTPADGPSPA